MNKVIMIIMFLLMILLTGNNLFAIDRCIEYITDVRIQHVKNFGISFPYWYGVGQLRQESCCRTNITAFDAGQGIAQFMPKTSQYIQSLMGQKLNPYNPEHAIMMQAFYMSQIHKKENWTDLLFITYQIYNGGKSLLYKEYQRAGKVDWVLMKRNCKRRVITLKSGRKLDFCEVNYDYSIKVKKYGNFYRRGNDGMRYW